MNGVLARAIAGFLVLIVSTANMPLLAQQTATPAEQNPPGQSTVPPAELPENPGRSATPEQTTPAPPPAAQPPAPAQPSGTAVAPPIQVSGGAASKPAGVAIAPPKQRQIRSLLIKLGFLAGAGIAVGTVVGLSAASPSHVPNSPGH